MVMGLMCNECGCEDKITKVHDEKDHFHKGEDTQKEVTLDRSVSEFNDNIALSTSNNLKDLGILCINLMGAPGSGKTTVIEGVSRFISPKEICVIQGDLESDIDKKRLEKIDIETYQINTHSGCHLNSSMVSKALLSLNLKEKKFLIIENVGNLVCPAGVKIGQHMNIVVSSTTEGSDKPKKYPYIFMDAEMIIISKTDLSDAAGFDEALYLSDIKKINSHAEIIKVSNKIGESYKEIAHELVHEREHLIGKHHHH
jgi:hydrogenase nickel incorporation protein HypB